MASGLEGRRARKLKRAQSEEQDANNIGNEGQEYEAGR